MAPLYNPFTPSEIAANPDDFFGRSDELNLMCNSLPQGSVAIQGVVGIGKSSLLSRGLIQMEGFDSDNSAKSVMAVGDKDVKTVDEAARLLLESCPHSRGGVHISEGGLYWQDHTAWVLPFVLKELRRTGRLSGSVRHFYSTLPINSVASYSPFLRRMAR